MDLAIELLHGSAYFRHDLLKVLPGDKAVRW